MTVDRDSQLENTLLKADYPAVRVATIDIPQQQLDQYQQAMVEHSLGKKIVYDGVEYCLVGASASAKNGKYYAVDAAHAKAIAPFRQADGSYRLRATFRCLLARS